MDECDCVFCFEEVELNNKTIECSICFHYFHSDCWKLYEKSLLKNKSNILYVKCPVCRNIISHFYYLYFIKVLLFFWFLVNTLFIMMEMVSNFIEEEESIYYI